MSNDADSWRTGLDVDRVGAWLTSVGAGLETPLEATPIAGGRSNLTYLLLDRGGRRAVLRRPPLGAVSTGAHDVGRELRIVAALANTGVPVPGVVASCADESVIGAPFVVMDFVPGAVLAGRDDAERYPLASRRAVSLRLLDVLVALHDIDPDAVGLGQLGRREDFLGRQLRRWSAQIEQSGHPEVEQLIDLHDQLRDRRPAQRYTGLLHGDFRLGNVLVAPGGAVNAVLDWELSTLGDQLTDLAWLLFSWAEPGEASLDPVPPPSMAAGFPTRGELVDRYATGTGRDVSDLGYYAAFAAWRAGCIAVGIADRYARGAMAEHEQDIGRDGALDMVGALAEQARNALGEWA